MMSTSRNGLISFTERQWEELEHQALIYKYMASGVPIPPHLLYPIRTTTTSSLDFSSNLILHQPQHIGWNCFQLGYGKKIDPEPGRCKRTDGKKWRCSKEAYADSKYCERHMHRGKNRSRKPVEVLSNNTSTPTPTAFPISSIKKNYSSHSPGIALSSQQQTKFLLDSGAYSRNSYGQEEMKEEADSWQLAPLTMGSPLGQLKQRTNCSVSQIGQQYYLQHQNESTNQQQRQYQYNHYNMKIDTEDEQQNKKVMHHFFDELPPQDNKDSWLDFEAKTDLSISVPNSSSHDFFINHNGK